MTGQDLDGDSPDQRFNARALLVQGTARRVANELSSEKLVLPFLYTALGGPVAFAAVFTPVIIVTRLVAQLAGARGVGARDAGKPLLAASTGVTAVVLAAVAAGSGSLASTWLAAAFVTAAALLGLGNGFGALVSRT